MASPLAAVLLLLCVAASAAMVVVDLQGLDLPTTFAAQTCVGLYNRDANNDTVAGPTYAIMKKCDFDWASNLGLDITPIITIEDLLKGCLADARIAKGYIKYNFTAQQRIVPNIVTLAAMLDAVPLEAGSPFITPALPLLFDAEAQWVGKNAHDVTEYMFEHHARGTQTLAMMNPGYRNAGGLNQWDPPLVTVPRLGLVDYIVKNRLFNFYMNNACVAGFKEHALMKRMATSGLWPTPIPVFGYNEAWNVLSGDLFETETSCLAQHNMGCVASNGANNMSFFSRAAALTKPLETAPEPPISYNSSETYVTLIIGDGDNLNYLREERMWWMRQRVAACQKDPSQTGCFPLVWSMSGWPSVTAPAWLQWYYAQARATGHDFFTLPPMGYLAAYPSMMPPDVADAFVKRGEDHAALLSVNSTVSWDWFYDWSKGLKEFYPRYSERGIIRGVFAVNVPFMVPILEFGHETYKFLPGPYPVVVFRPREWRGSSTSGRPPFSADYYLTPEQMADEINRYKPGTVTHIYLTSDGGGDLKSFYDMVPHLQHHVRLVSASQLIGLAFERSQQQTVLSKS